MRKTKSKEVKSFGGVSKSKKLLETNAKNAPVKDIAWDASQIEVESDTHLEDDEGVGSAAIIRCFEFAANPQAFGEHQPTKQELFNSHLKGIETMLWRDGMKIMPEVQPRIIFEQTTYKIFVSATPMRGHILRERPQTLSQIANDERYT